MRRRPSYETIQHHVHDRPCDKRARPRHGIRRRRVASRRTLELHMVRLVAGTPRAVPSEVSAEPPLRGLRPPCRRATRSRRRSPVSGHVARRRRAVRQLPQGHRIVGRQVLCSRDRPRAARLRGRAPRPRAARQGRLPQPPHGALHRLRRGRRQPLHSAHAHVVRRERRASDNHSPPRTRPPERVGGRRLPLSLRRLRCGRLARRRGFRLRRAPRALQRLPQMRQRHRIGRRHPLLSTLHDRRLRFRDVQVIGRSDGPLLMLSAEGGTSSAFGAQSAVRRRQVCEIYLRRLLWSARIGLRCGRLRPARL